MLPKCKAFTRAITQTHVLNILQLSMDITTFSKIFKESPWWILSKISLLLQTITYILSFLKKKSKPYQMIWPGLYPALIHVVLISWGYFIKLRKSTKFRFNLLMNVDSRKTMIVVKYGNGQDTRQIWAFLKKNISSQNLIAICWFYFKCIDFLWQTSR